MLILIVYGSHDVKSSHAVGTNIVLHRPKLDTRLYRDNIGKKVLPPLVIISVIILQIAKRNDLLLT